MFEAVISVLSAFLTRFGSRARLEAEVLALRHQVNILNRTAPKRVEFTGFDRLLFVWLYRLWPGLLNSVPIVRRQTIVRWHRQGFRAFWNWKSRGVAGRPRIPKQVQDLIREISLVKPLWGAPRIHGELPKLGIEVAQSTVAKYMVTQRRPPSQSWQAILRNHANGIATIDIFVVPTGNFKLLFGLVILRHDRRLLVYVGVTSHPTAEWISRQVSEAFPWESSPAYLIRDRDAACGEVFKRRLRAMGIRDRPTAKRSPWQNGYVERPIGTIRWERLDHAIIFNERHLRRVLVEYSAYYNTMRTHGSLRKDTPTGRPVKRQGEIRAFAHLGGLHHSFVRI